ncbi:MAG: DNA-binding protein [Candidatus Bathyarchaeia archaeon]|jgi:predicted transcriptional regulator of viral defense system
MSKKMRGRKKKVVFEIIKKAKKEISLGEIKSSTNINYNTIRSSVISLTKAGMIERIKRGVYKSR